MECIRSLVWLTQLGLSVATPLFVFILGAVWLQERTSSGGWIVILGIVLGLIGAASAGLSFYCASFKAKKHTSKKEPSVSFSEHD